MRSPVFLLMLPLMEQPTRIGPNSVAAMIPPTTANPIIVGTIFCFCRALKPWLLILVGLKVGMSSKTLKQLNPHFFAFDAF
jgi:hypothetical protein